MKRRYMTACAGLMALSLFVGCGNSESGAAGQTASAQQQAQEGAGKGLTGDVAPTFVVNAEGKVVYRRTGGVTKEQLEDVVNHL